MIRSPDYNCNGTPEEDGYLAANMQISHVSSMSTDAGSTGGMLGKNIHNLTIPINSSNTMSEGDYLPMRSPNHDTGISQTSSPIVYTHMGRNATPGRELRSPNSRESMPTSPVNGTHSRFQFPPESPTSKTNNIPNSKYLRHNRPHDSGVYSPTAIQNPVYYTPDEYNSYPRQNHKINGHLSVQISPSINSDTGIKTSEFVNLTTKSSRKRSTSESSSGLGSIDENSPATELLIPYAHIPTSIPEEQPCLQECTV